MGDRTGTLGEGRVATQRQAEDDCKGNYDRGGGTRATGTQRPGKQRRIRGERRGARQGDREAESKGWSGGSKKVSDKETEEDGMPAGELEGSEDMLTGLP